jgi:hypothetical protein
MQSMTFRVKNLLILKLSLIIDKSTVERFAWGIPVCHHGDTPVNISIEGHIIPECTNDLSKC